MKGTTNAQRNAVVDSSSAVDKLTLTMADGTTKQHTVSDMIPKDTEPTSGSAKFVTSGVIKTALDAKVSAETGKGLSTNDYTTTEKNKLAGISAGAQVNVIEEVQLNGAKITPSSKAVNIDLSGYATKGDLSSIPKFAISVVSSLPTSDISTSTIYLKSNGGSSGNSYDEYLYVNGAWEKIGTTEVDLSGYVPTTRKVNNKALSTDITLTAGDVGALPAGGTAVKATADANGNNIATTYATQTALTNGLAAKQNALTFDSAPTSGSSNPVTSGGVFSAINNLESQIPSGGEAGQVWTSDGAGAGTWATPRKKLVTSGDISQFFTISGAYYSVLKEFDIEYIILGKNNGSSERFECIDQTRVTISPVRVKITYSGNIGIATLGGAYTSNSSTPVFCQIHLQNSVAKPRVMYNSTYVKLDITYLEDVSSLQSPVNVFLYRLYA